MMMGKIQTVVEKIKNNNHNNKYTQVFIIQADIM